MIPVKSYWRLLRRYLAGQRRRVVLLSLFIFGGIVLQLVNPQLVRFFIDTALDGGEQRDLLAAAGAFMAIAIVHQILSVAATYIAENVGWSATNGLREDLAAHCLDLDMGFHKTHAPGEMIDRIDGDVTALSNFFSQFSIHVVGNFVLLIGILALLFRENVWIGAGLTVFAIAALAGMVKIQQIAQPLWKLVRKTSASFFSFLGEQLGGTEDIRGNGATGFMLRRFTEIMREWLPHTVKAYMGWLALWSTNILVFSIGTGLVFWLGNRFLATGSLTIGSVYLVFHYSEMLRQPLNRIRNQMEDLQKAGAGIDRVEELFAIESKLRNHGTARFPDGALGLEFNEVTFSYDDATDGHNEIVLDGVEFTLAPGRVVGVLGRTGSGKTTLARLLTRLYDPDRGEVRLGGVVAATAQRRDLRARVGMVTQDVQLFRASVRDNLTFFDPTIPDTRIHEALQELGLEDWAETLPDGLDTELESGGGGLSAGEAQLLAFTRIFLKDPGLVILDEASSRLDPATEQRIEHAVGRLLAGRTGIIIAHRLGTVARADDILILDSGRVVEIGERVRLAADPGSRFSRLLETGLEEVLA
jgi:ATP-binding cassette subfamily B protein